MTVRVMVRHEGIGRESVVGREPVEWVGEHHCGIVGGVVRYVILVAVSCSWWNRGREKAAISY